MTAFLCTNQAPPFLDVLTSERSMLPSSLCDDLRPRHSLLGCTQAG